MAAKQDSDVSHFMDALVHARKAEVQELRAAILASDPAIEERVKWNAPSFCHGGDDRVTLRLQPGDRLEIIFHRGAKKRADTDTFRFTDPTGLVRWLAPDRGVVVVTDAEDLRVKVAGIVRLVAAWVEATRDGG